MGQYHLTVNLDKREFVDPHRLGMGLKLVEQFGFEADMGAALLMLLAVANGKGGGDVEAPETAPQLIGGWGGNRIIVAGDYTENEDAPHIRDARDIYAACRFWQAADEKGRPETEAEYVKYLVERDYPAEMIEAKRLQHRRISSDAPYTDISDLVILALNLNTDLTISADGKREWKPGVQRAVYLSPQQGECLAAFARRATTQAKVNFAPGTLAALSGQTVEFELAHYDKARRTNALKAARAQGVI